MAAISGEQEDTEQGPQADPQAGNHKDSSGLSHQAPENK